MVAMQPKHQNKKLCFILTKSKSDPEFAHAINLLESALSESVQVYAYLIHEGVRGIEDPTWQSLVKRGLKLFGCAYSARQRNIPLRDPATWVGLTVLNDLLVECDKTVSF